MVRLRQGDFFGNLSSIVVSEKECFMLQHFITNKNYRFKEKNISPVPMIFRRDFEIEEVVEKAELMATAMGIYVPYVNGEKVGEEYFAPGFTSYKNTLLYQTYDMTQLLQNGKNILTFVVSGGWAVGAFVFTRKNRITAKRQALSAKLVITYTSGKKKVIETDENWLVSKWSLKRSLHL